MSEQSGGNGHMDPAAWSQAMARIAEQSQRLVADFVQRNQFQNASGGVDPMAMGRAFMEMTARLMSDPAKLMEAQFSLWQDYMNLWQSTAKRMMGQEADPVIAPAKDDRRFKDAAWQDNQVFDFVKQSYLLTARWLQSTVQSVDGLDDKTSRKIDFYTRQFVDAMAPSNFVLTNPEVLRATIDSRGENLVKGLENLLEDLERGKGQLKIRMTDLEAFEVGKNIAVTPGKVVYQNDLIQLLQYTPTTKEVAKRPLLIIPPWINKYYILDLKPANSFIKWAVDQGHSVFVISWVNPDEKLAAKSFEDYLLEGPIAALDAVEKATGEKTANVIGYCLGGTLLASLLAYLAAKGGAERIASATFLTTLVDFKEAGELTVFIDEEQLAALEEKMNERGYLEGAEMANTFNMLRANDLIWSFVINNYLLGKEPFPFDLLYWNSDFDAHAGGDAQLLSAQHVPEQPAEQTERDRSERRRHRPPQGEDAGLHPVDPRGSHRAVEGDLCRDPALFRSRSLRAGGVGPYRRRGQSADVRQIQPLDQRQGEDLSEESGRMAGERRHETRVLVARMAAMDCGVRRRQGAGARTGRRQAESDRGRAGFLRQSPGAVELTRPAAARAAVCR